MFLLNRLYLSYSKSENFRQADCSSDGWTLELAGVNPSGEFRRIIAMFRKFFVAIELPQLAEDAFMALA